MIHNFLKFIEKNHQYGYLLATLGFGTYLVGLILNWKWTLEPGGGSFNTMYWIEEVGEKTVRIILGIITAAGMFSCLALFIYYNNTPTK